jgi:ADP-ribose pyrophosphatase YjhB (NUDIX family)
MNNGEIGKLCELLKKLKEDNLVPPNTPYEIWLELATLVPMPAVEVIVTRDGKDFLLTRRKDHNWNGWHIPGGFMIYKESINEACQRIALKELQIKVEFIKVIDAYAWKDHPYGAPVSIVCVCESGEKPKEGKFFTEIPSNIINHHSDFLRGFLSSTKFK